MALAEPPVPVGLPVPEVGADQVAEVTRSVLARAEYAGVQPTLLDRFWLLLSDALGRLLDALTGSGSGSLLGTVIILGFAVVALAAAVRFARTVRPDPERAAAVDVRVGRSGDDWRADGAREEAAGDWRQALRCQYRALVADLARAGLVEEVAGRTAGEYLAAVRADLPAAAEPFARATAAFEAAWYGRRPVGPDDLAAVRGHARAVLRAAGLRDRRQARAAA